MRLCDKSILIISPEPWGTNYVSKHHYAAELAERNRVYFTGPPAWGRPFRTRPQSGESVQLLRYPHIPGLNLLPHALARPVRRLQAHWLRYLASETFDLVWSFDPFVFQDLSVFGPCLKIYHGVDLHACAWESACVANADLALFTSDQLLSRHATSPTPKFQVNHGLSRLLSSSQGQPVWTNHASGRAQVGLVGNLQSRLLDYDLLLQLATDHPEADFHLIGPTGNSNLGASERQQQLSRVLNLPNVRSWGAVHPSQLSKCYADLDVLLMLYQGDKYRMELANPHKLMEYLSTGKVTVCNYTDQYRHHRNLLVMADQQSELPALFSRVLARLSDYNAPEEMEKRRQFALENTYARNISKIEGLIAGVTGRP